MNSYSKVSFVFELPAVLHVGLSLMELANSFASFVLGLFLGWGLVVGRVVDFFCW